MFEGFALDRIDVGEAVLRVRHGGFGPPVLLLHGHPRTHATWYRVAPLLASEVPVTQARAEFADLVNRVAYGGERVVVTRHGKPIAALVPPSDLDRLQQDEQQSATVVRLATDGLDEPVRSSEPARRPFGIAAHHRPLGSDPGTHAE